MTSDHCVAVANASDKRELRISNIRPHVVGAVTEGKKLQVHVRNEGMCRIRGENKWFEFTHEPADTAFIQFTAFKSTEPYVPARTGDDGGLADEDGLGLDLLGLYGDWSLELQPSTSSEDTNFGLAVSGISDVIVYFKGCYRTSRPERR
jgi:hypothetical protein